MTNDVWATWIADISQDTALARVVHIGAGHGDMLAVLRETGAERMTLVEPDPTLAHALEDATAEDPSIRVLRVALAPADPDMDDAEVVFTRRAPAILSGGALPDGLSDLFPGLDAGTVLEVEHRSLAGILDAAGLDAEVDPTTTLLILDAPLAADGALAALAADPALSNRVSHVLIHTVDIADPDARTPRLLAVAEAAGFAQQRADASDPDFPWYHLFRQPVMEAEPYPDPDPDIEGAQEPGEDPTPTLEDELLEVQAELSTQKAKNEALFKSVKAAEAERDAAQRDLTLALRMQTLHKRDMADLRDRYNTLQTIKRSQDKLLSDLAAPLRQALVVARAQAQAEEEKDKASS